MIRRILLQFILLSLIGLVGCIEESKNVSGDLKEGVKSVIEISYKIKGEGREKSNGDIDSKIVEYYDENGNKIGYEKYDSNGLPIEKTQIEFDGNGNELVRTDSNYDYGKITEEWKGFKKYDDKGNQIESTVYLNGNLDTKSIDVYNDKGENTESFYYNSDGSLEYKSVQDFDSRGNRIVYSKINPMGYVLSEEKQKHSYDSNGNKMETLEYDENGNLKETHKFKYDNQGNRIEGIHYDSNGILTSRNFEKYDNEGNRIEWISNVFNSKDGWSNTGPVGSIKSKSIYRYDKWGNTIEEIVDNSQFNPKKWIKRYELDDFGNTTKFEYFLFNEKKNQHELNHSNRYEYTYDSNNNWIIQKVYYKDELLSIYEREIEYYN